jgi:hypothetical protein
MTGGCTAAGGVGKAAVWADARPGTDAAAVETAPAISTSLLVNFMSPNWLNGFVSFMSLFLVGQWADGEDAANQSRANWIAFPTGYEDLLASICVCVYLKVFWTND